MAPHDSFATHAVQLATHGDFQRESSGAVHALLLNLLREYRVGLPPSGVYFFRFEEWP
jgi:hypothetical protein